jgi:hypothetical protein
MRFTSTTSLANFSLNNLLLIVNFVNIETLVAYLLLTNILSTVGRDCRWNSLFGYNLHFERRARSLRNF